MISKPLTIAAIILTALTFAPTTSAKTSNNKTRKLTASQQHAPAATEGTFEARVEALIRQSGYDFRKVKANSWYCIVPGKSKAQFRIILGAGSSSIAVGAVVVEKKNLRITAEGMQKIMKLNYDLNYMRVCIDSDDDLIIMSQRKDKWLDPDEFKNTVLRVSEAADRAYTLIQSDVITPGRSMRHQRPPTLAAVFMSASVMVN